MRLQAFPPGLKKAGSSSELPLGYPSCFWLLVKTTHTASGGGGLGKSCQRMGLEAGTNKNKTDGGLAALNGLSDSNASVKLTVKVTDEHCSKKRRPKLQRNASKGFKTAKQKHCVGKG